MFAQRHLSIHIRVFLLFLFLVAGTPVLGVEIRQLELDPNASRYEAELILNAVDHPQTNHRMSHVLCEVDGDGLMEYVRGYNSKALGYDGEDGQVKVRWQMNIDPNYVFQEMSPILGAVADFNGDGLDEIYTTIVTRDRSDWRFLVLDPALEEFTVNVPLPLGGDRRPDGVWDGTYLAVGTVNDADGRGRPGVVLLRTVQYDATLRGLCAVDPFTGEIIWAWECGPNLEHLSPAVTDLDGDGDREIIAFGTSPDNLGGALVNGTSDNKARVFVLDGRGNLLWQNEIGPYFTDGRLKVADLDGDGVKEVITFTRRMQVNQTNKLTIWDGLSGRMISQVRGAAGFEGLAVTEGPQPGTSWLFAGSNDGVVDRFLFDGSSLARDLRVLRDETVCQVVGEVDILPEEGPEILVDVGEGAFFAVLDRDLKALAVFAEDGTGPKQNPSLWRIDMDHQTLALGNGRTQWVLGFQRSSGDFLATARKAGLGLLVLAAGVTMFLLGRWRGRREKALPAAGSRTADREVMYRLWRQLDDVKHEKMLEASRGLRRLVWLLDAYATDMGASSDLGERIRQLMGDYTEVLRPRLEGILQLARSEGFETEIVEATATALDALTHRLHGLTAADLNVAQVAAGREAMKGELGQVEQGLLTLWESVRTYFSTDPVRLLKGMMLIREGDLVRAGIEAHIAGAESIRDSLCLIDSGDLRYVLDNLVDNAVRAMEITDDRRLILKIERKNSEISLHVTDSGPGVPPEIRDRIFTGRFSTRHGGGSGLFRSRDILHRWGGDIILVETPPGQGATFSVRLRAARKIEPGTAAEASA